MADDFPSGAHHARFPATHRSAVIELGSDDPATRARSFETVARAYFRPVYAHVRLRWNKPSEEARELTQGFFAEAFEKRYLGGYDPGKAHFRTFLKLCLDRFVGKEARSRRRLKRGAGIVLLSLDFDGAEAGLSIPTGAVVDACFDREWARSVLGLAVGKLREACRQSGKEKHFAMFEAVVLEDDPDARPSYAALASAHDVSVSDVTNYLGAMRRELRRACLATLRELTASEQEFEDEARALLGKDP